ncbi:right-handed parallel beta-helix repeat-containing protein [Myxococcus sp. CA039A]|uniref:right-handed parallel beta-helix repeat-containing protein n=1 Tax=Myxococcus sp. CA039A TaxID=2741737 RepID=UPI00157B5D31|nr:right-handed parallel beta-helix repeat-containing protein [Myxococcus sp. CA039A]NTX50204.1 right-handed parallel beta-helix repeat-containing protein [Myxococcus sp. CA039A]
MNRANAMRLALLASALVLATGCHQEEPLGVQVEPAGSLRVVTVLPRSLPLDSVSRVEVSATPARGAVVTAALSSSEAPLWQGLLRSLPSGAGTSVGARVLDATGAVLGQVDVPGVELLKHHDALVVLVPRATDSEAPLTAPVIDAVVGSRASVSPGAVLKLRALAHAVDASEVLTYAWSATSGTFDDATAVDAEWTAPLRRGAVNLTLAVTSARGAVSTLRFSVDVELAGGGDLVHTASLNHAPVLTELGAQPVSQARVGLPVTLQAVGVDDDGDALTFAWTATCEGTFENAAAAATRFTPSAAPQAACDNCRLTLRASDGFGAHRERSLDLCVTNPLPPSIIDASQSETDVSAGRPVRLTAMAADPQGEPLTFAWTTNTGLLGNAVRERDSGSVDWVVLSCIPVDTPPTITLTVTNLSGLSATREFAVEWGDLLCGEFPPCAATLEDSRVTLAADCTTEQSVWIPDGYTFDGAGHVLTAVDPRGRRFRGAVLSSLGTTAHVRAVTVAARGLSELACDGGAARLRGILFEGASGSIVDSEVLDVNQKEGEGGCQEGVAIEVRNARDAETVTRVEVLRNRVARYQKAGISGTGRVELNVEDNQVEGGGPVPFIARNGIQFSDGATGRATGNRVTGNAYSGGETTGSGILVAGGAYYDMALCEDVVIFENTLVDNDVGINLSQAEEDGGPLSVSTRLRVTRNTVTHDGPVVTNGYPYQAGISDLGGANLISQNHVSGPGYARETEPDVTFDVDVVAGTASRLDFLTPDRETGVGQCSEELVVQSQDTLGNLSALTAPSLVLEVAGTAAPGAVLYSDATCTQALATSGTGWALALEGPQQEATFYFRATQAGALTLTATGAGASGTQAHTVR